MNISEALKGKGPPKDVAPNALVAKLVQAEAPSEVLPFPRRDADGNPLFEFRMKVLTQQEIDIACANAERHTRTVLREKADLSNEDVKHVRVEAWDEIYQNARLIELLFHACKQVDDIKRGLFDAPGQLRKLLTADECAALFQMYVNVQYRYGPQWQELTEEEIDQWIDVLTEGIGSRAPLALLQLQQGQLAALVTSLAYRLRSSKTDTGSYGSPSTDGENETSPTEED